MTLLVLKTFRLFPTIRLRLRAETTRAFYTSHRVHLAFFSLLNLPLV